MVSLSCSNNYFHDFNKLAVFTRRFSGIVRILLAEEFTRQCPELNQHNTEYQEARINPPFHSNDEKKTIYISPMVTYACCDKSFYLTCLNWVPRCKVMQSTLWKSDYVLGERCARTGYSLCEFGTIYSIEVTDDLWPNVTSMKVAREPSWVRYGWMYKIWFQSDYRHGKDLVAHTHTSVKYIIDCVKAMNEAVPFRKDSFPWAYLLVLFAFF